MAFRSNLERFVPGFVISAAGFVPGCIYDTQFGRNTDVDGAEDVWGNGGEYTGQPVTAGGSVLGVEENFEILSDSADDTSDGTGAQTVDFTYLDDAGVMQTGTVALNGTTGVDTGVSGVRCFSASCATFGSGGTNAGTITIRHITTTSRVFISVLPEVGQSEVAAITVPAGMSCVISEPLIHMDRLGGAAADAAIVTRKDGQNGYVIRNVIRGSADTPGRPDSGLVSVPALTDIKLRVFGISAGNQQVVGQFNYAFLEQ